MQARSYFCLPLNELKSQQQETHYFGKHWSTSVIKNAPFWHLALIMTLEVKAEGEFLKAGVSGAVKGATESVTGKTYQTYTKFNEITGETYSGRISGTGNPEANVAKGKMQFIT